MAETPRHPAAFPFTVGTKGMTVMAKQTLSERDLFRILSLRYFLPLVGWTARVPKEVVERLRFWFPYCHRSLPQLRRMVLKALSDPRTGKLLDADFHPPTDGALG